MARLSLSQNEFKILAVLSSGEQKHGYGILKLINDAAPVERKILIGSLYNTLKGMEKKGFVESVWAERDANDHKPQRRYYKITGLGERVYREDEEVLVSIWLKTQNPILKKFAH
ncbi:MAG: helix-turn-helix transcriptional regulator [Bacteroidia bacterium]|nr:helix-turn-helix transcriptional regulator [Bacteroidia bacterium]